jgi:ATP/maltotriose-dependent transcriptional regulator MalT
MAAVSAAPVDVCRQRIFALVAAIGFLSEFDAAGEQRFRFHPLFQDALRSIAESHGPQHAQRRRAAAWFVARDDVDAGWLEYFAESPNLHAAIERMRSIYKKLGVHSRAEAVRVAREGGVGEQSRESG